jgi:hypothetical protein
VQILATDWEDFNFLKIGPQTSCLPKHIQDFLQGYHVLLLGAHKKAVSSAYKDVLISFDLGEIWCKTLFSITKCRILWRGSIARMKSMGEMGSPCLRPLSCLIGRPEIPFKRILEEEEVKTRLIQSLNLAPKANLSNTSSKYAHETESKAFAMSSLRKRAGIFYL